MLDKHFGETFWGIIKRVFFKEKREQQRPIIVSNANLKELNFLLKHKIL